MLPREFLNLRLRQSGKIRCLVGDNSPKFLWMMCFEILSQEPNRAAFTRPMSDEDDGFGTNNIHRDLLVVGVFLRYTITFVVRFLTVDQVVLEAKGIVGSDGDSASGSDAGEIVINVGVGSPGTELEFAL